MIDGTKLSDLDVEVLTDEEKDVVHAYFNLDGDFLVEEKKEQGINLHFHENYVNVSLYFSSCQRLSDILERVKTLVRANLANRKDLEALAEKASAVIEAEFGGEIN